jgi:integrase
MGSLGVSSKTLNNYLIPLRGVFIFAMKDGAITKNPADGIENARVQKPQPDPFEQADVELIIEDLARNAHLQIANYFEAAFFGGFRPSELIAIQWKDVDFKRRNVRVQRAIVRGKPKDSTKTYVERDVELIARAWGAFEAQRQHTQLAGREVFWNPITGQPWADIQMQWRYWRACLQRLGLRYREPYQTRHTFATLALMAGNNPAWIARQMGNSAPIMFKTYTKWIDGADRGVERAKMDAATADLPHEQPQLPARK